MAQVFLIEYTSFGGRKKGGDDDSTSALPQIPGRIVQINEIDTGVTNQVVLGANTAFCKLQSFGGDVYFNHDNNDVGDGATVVVGNRDRLAETQVHFFGVLSNKTGLPFVTKVNLVSV